jgi:hypothetical protein
MSPHCGHCGLGDNHYSCHTRGGANGLDNPRGPSNRLSHSNRESANQMPGRAFDPKACVVPKVAENERQSRPISRAESFSNWPAAQRGLSAAIIHPGGGRSRSLHGERWTKLAMAFQRRDIRRAVRRGRPQEIKMSEVKHNAVSSTVRIADQTVTRGNGGEVHQPAGGDVPVLTTQQGIPVSDDQNSLRIGQRGPLALEDFHFREKVMHFDHERIPERVVHARGFGAHGFFENYASLAALTKADIFQRVGERTPAFVRFSTVAGNNRIWLVTSAGSP